jgi:hypothetical protein
MTRVAPKVIRRLAAILVVWGMGLPASAPAQSPGLAAFSIVSEGVDALASAVQTFVDAWGHGLQISDARQCRVQKQNLSTLVASLNLLVVDKTILIDRLDSFVAGPGAQDWGSVQEAAGLIQSDLGHLSERLRQLADHFSAPPRLSAAYRDILLSLEARKSLLMQGIEQLSLAEQPSAEERVRLAETAGALRREVTTLQEGIAAVAEAIDRPCPEFG